MRKLLLAEWAALGEIVASAGVIISLVFLAYSVNRNNDYLQATTDNLMYELQNDIYTHIVGSPDISAMRVKIANGDALSDIESDRYQYFLWKQMNVWELAFDRHQQGMLSDDKWHAWNRSFAIEILSPPLGLPRDQWEADNSYGPEFHRHVEAMYEDVQ